MLGIIIIFLFSVVAFLFFNEFYTHTEGDIYLNYANRLYLAFTSTLNNGIRYIGGIGQAIEQVHRSHFFSIIYLLKNKKFFKKVVNIIGHYGFTICYFI